MTIVTKRIYDPKRKSDGTRVLIDRLWPRGVSKARAGIDLWAKELAPSNALRKWLHVSPDKRYTEFKAKYRNELSSKKAEAGKLFKGLKRVTLITAARDVAHSHVPVFESFLKTTAKGFDR